MNNVMLFKIRFLTSLLKDFVCHIKLCR